MPGRQQVEQLTLHLRTGQSCNFLFELATQQSAQLFDAFQAQRLGKIIVGHEFTRDFDGLDRNVERGGLTFQVVGRVIIGKLDGDRLFLARFHADQVFFKPGNEATGAQFQRRIFGGAAFERHAIQLADEIDHDLVAIGGHSALCGVDKRFLTLCDTQHGLIDFAIGNRHGQLFQLQPVGRRRFDHWQHFERDRQFGVLTLVIAIGQFDRRLGRGAQTLVGDQLVESFANRGLQRFLVERRPVHLAHQIGRHFAGAKAGHAQRRCDLLDLTIDARGDICGRNGHGIGPLQALVAGFHDLHQRSSNSMYRRHVSCSKIGAGPEVLVRAKGFEPPHLAILEPKSSASTSSATPASGERRATPLSQRVQKGKSAKGRCKGLHQCAWPSSSIHHCAWPLASASIAFVGAPTGFIRPAHSRQYACAP